MECATGKGVVMLDGGKFRGVFGILAAVAAFSLCFAAGAETVTRTIVTQLATGGVKLYNVDSDGTWTPVRTIVSNGSSYLKRSCRALVHDGVVYALDMIKDPNNDGTGGYVRKFSMTGEYLGNLGWFPGQAEGLCLSSDKKFLYIGYAFQLLSGQVDRMSLEDGSVTTFATGLGQIRQICTDGKGRLYTAGRNSGPITILDEATGTKIASVSKAAQGIAYDPENDWLWWCQSGSAYGTMDRDGNILTTKADGPMGASCFAVSVVDGRPCFGSYTTGCAYRLEENGTFTTLVSGLSSLSDLNEVPIDPIAQWNFDETTNAPAFMNAYGDGVHAIHPMGLLQSGATGVSGGCVYFGGSCARGEIDESHALVPATNDFTVAFWAGMPAAATEETPMEQYLFSNHGIIAGRFTIMANLDSTRDKICLFFGPEDSETYKIFSGNGFADGAWHHVAVVRRAGDFELWMDGVIEGNVACEATNAIGHICNWHVGSAWTQAQGQVQEGAFMDDLRIYDEALNATMIGRLFSASTPSGVPTKPAAPEGALAMPAALGTEVAHAYACDAAIGAPSLLVAQDGTYYLASARGNRGGAYDQTTTLYKSTDRGATWTAVSQCAVGNGALFDGGGKLCLMGNTVASTAGVSVFTSDDSGATWTSAASSTSDGVLWDFSAASPLVVSGRVWQAGNYLSDSAVANAGFVSFAVNGSAFSDPKWVTTPYPEHASLKGSGHDTLHAVLPGQMLAHDGAAKLLAPLDDRRTTDANCLLGAERYMFGDATTTACKVHPFFPLPGSAKRFSVRYDETSQLYWAVTAAVTNYLQLATKDAAEIRDTLALYASPDLKEWRPCGVVATSADAAFIAPTLDFDGSDLVLAYAVAADDGAGGARSVADGNYLAVRRVANFRTAYKPFEPGSRRVLMTDFLKFSILSYYPGPDGQWYSGGEFATEVNGYVFNVMGIAASHGRVYATHEVNSGSGHIFVFKNDGTFVRTITAPAGVRTDNIRISKDGSYLLVADPFGTNAIWKYSITSNAWTKLCAYDSSDTSTGAPNQVRGLALASDGSFYAMGRNSSSPIRHFAADGSLLETVVTLPNVSHLALHLDEQANVLYYA